MEATHVTTKLFVALMFVSISKFLITQFFYDETMFALHYLINS